MSNIDAFMGSLPEPLDGKNRHLRFSSTDQYRRVPEVGQGAVGWVDVDSHFKLHFPSPEEDADNKDWTKPLARQLGGRAAWQAFEPGGLSS
jgi:hypothetical protein